MKVLDIKGISSLCLIFTHSPDTQTMKRKNCISNQARVFSSPCMQHFMGIRGPARDQQCCQDTGKINFLTWEGVWIIFSYVAFIPGSVYFFFPSLAWGMAENLGYGSSVTLNDAFSSHSWFCVASKLKWMVCEIYAFLLLEF